MCAIVVRPKRTLQTQMSPNQRLAHPPKRIMRPFSESYTCCVNTTPPKHETRIFFIFYFLLDFFFYSTALLPCLARCAELKLKPRRAVRPSQG